MQTITYGVSRVPWYWTKCRFPGTLKAPASGRRLHAQRGIALRHAFIRSPATASRLFPPVCARIKKEGNEKELTLPNPEEVTSQSLLSGISSNRWVKARAQLIAEYAEKETALRAADEIEKLLDAEGDAVSALRTWVKVTRETAGTP